MRTKLVIAVAVVVAIGGAYYAGDAAQRTLRRAAEARATALQDRVDAAEARVRVAELLGKALTLKETAVLQNYGQALALSSPFFDAVRAEEMQAPAGPLRDGMTYVLAQRDMVTTGLAKSDPFVVGSLHDIELRLRMALGYGVPAESASVPAADQSAASQH
jgi:hypothetical protein